jgi:hypothetical protein
MPGRVKGAVYRFPYWRVTPRIGACLCLLWALIHPLVGSFAAEEAGSPIAVDAQNGHYYILRGKPPVLITSAEHYGAVLPRVGSHSRNGVRIWAARAGPGSEEASSERGIYRL